MTRVSLIEHKPSAHSVLLHWRRMFGWKFLKVGRWKEYFKITVAISYLHGNVWCIKRGQWSYGWCYFSVLYGVYSIKKNKIKFEGITPDLQKVKYIIKIRINIWAKKILGHIIYNSIDLIHSWVVLVAGLVNCKWYCVLLTSKYVMSYVNMRLTRVNQINMVVLQLGYSALWCADRIRENSAGLVL